MKVTSVNTAMSRASARFGNVLIAVGLAGLVLWVVVDGLPSLPAGTEGRPFLPQAMPVELSASDTPSLESWMEDADSGDGVLVPPTIDTTLAEGLADRQPVAGPRPITGLRIQSISLETEVAPSKFLTKEATWEVPAFKAGHAEFSGGAGQRGNAVLLGHLTSLSSGSVFRDLQRVKVGDLVEVWSGPTTFGYRVTDVSTVPRTDVSVVHPTEGPSISLITCAGVWLPQIWDYTERLVVRGELVDSSPT